MKVHRFWILTIICCTTYFTSSVADEPRIVCYYTNWSIYRPGNAKYSPQNINPYLCTHLIYAFGGFTKDNTLQPFDKYQDIEKGGYAKFTGLKTYNKNLKTLLAIGGWNEGSARFSPLVGSPERRREFVKNTVKYLRQNHFDGLDLDWEYPTFRDGGKLKDRANYAQLVQELSEEFDRESSKTGRPRLLLTLAIPAGVDKIDKGYDVVKLNQYLDWFNVLTYDYHDSFEPATNHHAPLYSLEEDNEYNYDSELNIDFSIKHLINVGADRQKLVLGIPTYGRSYTLFNADATDIGAPTDGPGEPGDATREKGFLAYYEICQNIKSDEEWVVMHPNDKAMGPYSYKNDQWISYDDEKMAIKKAKYVADNNLGGIMFWSIDTDDFRGTCSGKPYPLIEAAKQGFLDALGFKSNEAKDPPSKTTTRNKNRPSTGSTNFKDTFNRRRRPSPKTTIRPQTKPAIVYNSKTTTPEPPTTPDPGSDFKCEEDGFFPHPRDCKRYFWCLDSGPSNLGIVAHQFTCPSGLVFNKQADSCDYSRNVVCSKTSPTTTKVKPLPTTTYKTTTKLSTTQRTTTFKSTTQTPTTTSATPPYEEDDIVYDYEIDDAEPERDIEDPKVIKELIDLIRKAGGLEELEKQLKFTEENLPSIDSTQSDKSSTTQSTFSKTLYDKFLKRKQLENANNKVKPINSELRTEDVNSTRYSSVIRNSRPSPQNAGLENVSDFNAFLKEKPKYVTIQRFRSTTPTNFEKIHEEDSEELNDNGDDDIIEISTKSNSQPQYVNIIRNRFTTQSAIIEELDEPDRFIQNPLTIESITSTPQYTTINRRRRPDIRTEISPVLEAEITTLNADTLNPVSTRTRYKPISRVTTAAPQIIINSEPDLINTYYENQDEDVEITTKKTFLNSDTKYQNFNRRNLVKTSVDTTILPTEEVLGEMNVPQTTVLISTDHDNYSINLVPQETTPNTTDTNLNKPNDELTSNLTQIDYNQATPNLNETLTGVLSDIEHNNEKILIAKEVVTVENATEIIATELSSPSPFEFQQEHNKSATIETSTIEMTKLIYRNISQETTTESSVIKYAIVTELKTTNSPVINRKTTTTSKPVILNHIFSINYEFSEELDGKNHTNLGQNTTIDRGHSSKEEISKRLEKLVEINRIVVIHSKQDRHKIKSFNGTDLMIEKLPTLDKIGEISRWISVKLQNNNKTDGNKSIVLDSKSIFDVETSTIPLEGLFDQNKILIENNFNENEVVDYQIVKPPHEMISLPFELDLDNSSENKTTVSSPLEGSYHRHRFNLSQKYSANETSPIVTTASNDLVFNTNNVTVSIKLQDGLKDQVNTKRNLTTIGQTSSTTIRPFVNFKKRVTPSRVAPAVLRRKTSFTSTTTQPKTATPKIFSRRKLYSRPSPKVTKPIIDITTVDPDIDTTTPETIRVRKPPNNINSKFVRPIRRKNNNNFIPQGRNNSTIVDDQFLSQTITTNSKQLASELNGLSNSSFINDEISDILKAMSETPLPVSGTNKQKNKSRQTIRNKPINRRPSKPVSTTEKIPIKSTTEGRRKLFQKIQSQPKSETEPKIFPKLPNDYDYYDDNESQIGHRENSQVKVILHETGAIECLDQGNFPHPLSCKKFISCAKIETGGVIGWEYTCPRGLNYDPVGGMCNWATGLGCKN